MVSRIRCFGCLGVCLAVLALGCRDATISADPDRADPAGAPAGEIRPDTQTDAAKPTAVPSRAAHVEVSKNPPALDSPALIAFLKKFDVLSAQGFVPTLRSGSTGIGYTLETMLDIEENNSPGGDFLGMELKAFRDDDLHMDDAEKMNLFLKEPKWIDGLQGKQRVRKYGYIDDNGRPALYSTVTINRNSHGFGFRVDRLQTQVWMQFDGVDVAYWDESILEKRLREKHSQAVFVAAHAQGKKADEQFHYYAVTWCADPSVDAFVEMIESGAVMLELRMHLKPTGGLRNHGSAFRIKQNRIPDLYRVTKQVRPVEVE